MKIRKGILIVFVILMWPLIVLGAWRLMFPAPTVGQTPTSVLQWSQNLIAVGRAVNARSDPTCISSGRDPQWVVALTGCIWFAFSEESALGVAGPFQSTYDCMTYTGRAGGPPGQERALLKTLADMGINSRFLQCRGVRVVWPASWPR